MGRGQKSCQVRHSCQQTYSKPTWFGYDTQSGMTAGKLCIVRLIASIRAWTCCIQRCWQPFKLLVQQQSLIHVACPSGVQLAARNQRDNAQWWAVWRNNSSESPARCADAANSVCVHLQGAAFFGNTERWRGWAMCWSVAFTGSGTS